ncbi:hypothetical protein LCGC14_2489050 [marine sediment metagenome]|uniref:Uncharacterized protein n=1 Tax=marine sediment metagenome TaxID=412755 RepID=A0A0F9B609_9ZZZZ
MTDQDSKSWTSHRLLVLALLERHDVQIKECEDNYHLQREEFHGRIAVLKTELNGRIDSRYDALNSIHKEMIIKVKKELVAEMKEAPEVTVAKITKRWEFWAMLVASLTSIVIALIALLN